MRNASTALEATQIAKSADSVSTSPLCLFSTSSTTGASVSATCSGAISNSASMMQSDRSLPTQMPVSVAAKIRNGKSDKSPEKAMKPAIAEPSLRLNRSNATQRTRQDPLEAPHGNRGAAISPIVSGSPSIRFAFWMAWPDEPLVRLSSAANTITRPGRRSGITPRCTKFEPRTWRVAGASP